MEIHRYERLWLIASLLLIVGFIATVTYGAVGVGIQMVDDSGGQLDPQTLSEHPRFSEPGVYQTGPDEYAVYVIAQQFAYVPGTGDSITVPAGAEVTFYVTSSDVVHGFYLVGTNVNSMAIPGQVAELTVVFDEAREYGLICHEYCGSGHHQMAGTVEVVPPGQFNESEEVVNA
jgi:cytochrome c oxidase subunit 2